MSILKFIGIYTPTPGYVNKGTYRADYRDEPGMQFTDKDAAVLARLAAQS